MFLNINKFFFNHYDYYFFLKKKFQKLKIYQYDCSIVSTINKVDRDKVRWFVFLEFVNKNIFGKCYHVFDLNRSIYCSVRFPFEKKEFTVCTYLSLHDLTNF